MWKDIKGYEGFYQVSTDGHVRRLFADGRTRNLKDRDGLYLTVCLSKKCNKHSVAIHRLVAETFLEKPVGATEVNHKDGNKHNNNVDNLEWVTQKQNREHAEYVLNKNPFGKPPRKVRSISLLTGEVVAEYRSISEAARACGTMNARAGIVFSCQGLQNSAYGYKWEYAD